MPARQVSTDNLVQKAWELYQNTAHFPAQTIVTAVARLEEKYHEKPCCKIALAISLHDLLLALRHDPAVESDIALDY